MTFVPPLPDNARCACCGGPFRCGADDPAPCACATVQLDDAQRAALRERFSGCLCVECLRELSRGPRTASSSPSPS